MPIEAIFGRYDRGPVRSKHARGRVGQKRKPRRNRRKR